MAAAPQAAAPHARTHACEERPSVVVLLSRGFVPYSDRGTNQVDNKCEKEEKERERECVY